MPSRFQDLEPHMTVPNRHPQWDHYDDMPLDPAYIAPLGLAACTRKPTV